MSETYQKCVSSDSAKPNGLLSLDAAFLPNLPSVDGMGTEMLLGSFIFARSDSGESFSLGNSYKRETSKLAQ